jgi:hypothetical protein
MHPLLCVPLQLGGGSPAVPGRARVDDGHIMCVCVWGGGGVTTKSTGSTSTRTTMKPKLQKRKRNDQQPYNHRQVQKAPGAKSRQDHITVCVSVRARALIFEATRQIQLVDLIDIQDRRVQIAAI